jgi:putative flippase GtrA
VVREDLEDTYEKLKRRHKSYSKKSTPGNILFLVGLIILFWGTLFLLAIYGDILHPLIGLGLGIILTYIGIKSAAKSEPLELSNPNSAS